MQYDNWSTEQESTTVTVDRHELDVDSHDEAFMQGMKAPWNSEHGLVSLSRNAIGTDTSHTTEVDPSEIEARTLLLWGADDEFQPISYAEQLDSDIPDAELVGLDPANHWVVEDQTDAYRRELRLFLDEQTEAVATVFRRDRTGRLLGVASGY